jgi:serine/threonine protein kinase
VSESVPGTIGKYQVIREIARSNDIVYEAYDPRMNRRVAVKELAMPKGVTAQQREDRLKRFEREARAAGSLVHPNIVTIYEVGTDGDKNYIAMEFLTGRNLRKEIDKTGFIEPKHAVEVAIEILEGLSFAHEHGVIHRDIKPDNVQLLDDGQIKLTDFGIARLTFEPNITMDGQVFGTPSYMSPEQINGQEIDARSDLFGVGVLLYEMVSGQKPFQGDSVVSITYAIMNKKPDQPQQANWPLWQVIERALDKTPDMRYRSAGEMVEALKQVMKGYATGVFEPQQQQQTAFNPTQVVAGPPPVYNPYGQNPNVAPYGAPMPMTVYTQPYGQGQYQPYQGTPPTGQVPVYYPPPAKTPILKPEHKQGIANFFIAVLLIGAVIGFVILVINALTGPKEGFPALQPSTSNEQSPLTNDADVAGSTGAQPNTQPTNEIFPTRPDNNTIPNNSQTSAPQIASLMTQAEMNANLAGLSDSPGLRANMYVEADRLYSQAIDAAPSAEKDLLRSRAVNTYTSIGQAWITQNDYARAREAYRRAKGFASYNPQLMAELDKTIEMLGG